MQSSKILKFYSPSCMPCKLLTNVLKQLEVAYEDIDITDDNNSQLVMKYNIRTVPTLVKVDSVGNEINKLIGFPKTNIIEEFCNEIN